MLDQEIVVVQAAAVVMLTLAQAPALLVKAIAAQL
jgi:hypothetical protein